MLRPENGFMPAGAVLLQALAGAPGTDPDLQPAVTAMWDRARAAWPAIVIEAEQFLPYVAERLAPDVDVIGALADLHAGDLYLACACVRGDAQALSAFDNHFISRVSAYLSRADALPAFTDEVKQTLRARLLVADSGLLPRLGGYAGRGPLGAWLWMSTTRVAVDLRRESAPNDAESDLALLADRATTPDPELAYLKAEYGPAFREVFRDVLAALPERDRSLLRLVFVDGLNTDKVGVLFGVSRWTANRRIAALCTRIFDETKVALAARLGIPATNLNTLLRVIQSEMALSVRDILRG